MDSNLKDDLKYLKEHNTVDSYYHCRKNCDNLDYPNITGLEYYLLDNNDYSSINKEKLSNVCFDVFNDDNKHYRKYILNHLNDYVINQDDTGSGSAVITKSDLADILKDNVYSKV